MRKQRQPMTAERKAAYITTFANKHKNTYTSGVYSITNTITGKVYVGACRNIYNRWSHHRTSLRNNQHPNAAMQLDYNLHGSKSFVYKVVEKVSISKLRIKENLYLEAIQATPTIHYNRNFTSNNPDLKSRKYFHRKSNTTVELTPFEFRTQYQLNQGNFSSFMNGKLNSIAGWVLVK